MLRPSPPRSTRNFTGWCFAKKAAAFFRMSRSSAASRFSFRSRASSSRSAVVRPVLALRPIGPGALDPLAQRRLGQIEVARDGADVLPSSSTRRTACGLELVSELPARPSAWRVCHRSDIVSTFRKMSTKPDQAEGCSASRSVLRESYCAVPIGSRSERSLQTLRTGQLCLPLTAGQNVRGTSVWRGFNLWFLSLNMSQSTTPPAR